ncbi:MAG: O-antigen ligase family protein [Alicyclobacillaceae bacterium]|nr:O-antigen ligase family protein [Alicyclobacillaceae bacterium]
MDGQGVVQGLTAPAPDAGGLARSRLVRYGMYCMMSFPIVDFALRLHGVHPLGVIWDKLVLLVLVCTVVWRYLSGVRPRWFSWQKLGVWYMVFGLGLMFAGMASPLIAIQGYRIDVYYILFAYMIPIVVEPEDVELLLHIGAMTAILIAVHGIYQYITKAPMPAAWVDTSQHVRTRVYSVLQSPNELGSYMALMTPLIAGLAIHTTDRWRRVLYAGGAVCCALTLLFTFTRGAWVALVLSLFIVSVLFERRLLFALVLIAVLAYFVPPIHHRIGELFSPVYWMKSASSGRISRWLQAFDLMSTNPLFGVGLGHYGGAVASIYHKSIYSDNYYAKTLGEVGLVGLTLFISMHIALMRDLFRGVLRKASGRARYIAIGGFTGLLAVLIHNSMENVFEFGPMAAAYFVYAALFLTWGRGLGEERGLSKEVVHEAVDSPSP